MNKKALILSLPMILAVFLLGGWLIIHRMVPISTTSVVPDVVSTVPEGNGQIAGQNRLQHIESIPGNSDEVWYLIPEMGVKMKLNRGFADDLYYGLTEWRGKADGNSLDFYLTNQVAKGVPSCSDWISLGGLFRYEGDLEELKRRRDELDLYLATRLDEYTQVGNYYYGWIGPHDVCWDVSIGERVKEAFLEKYSGSGANGVSEGIKTLELIP